jgi:hypothetical protein
MNPVKELERRKAVYKVIALAFDSLFKPAEDTKRLRRGWGQELVGARLGVEVKNHWRVQKVINDIAVSRGARLTYYNGVPIFRRIQCR